MPQPSTHLIDATVPNTQEGPFNVPITWTAGRDYSFANVTSFLNPDVALVYKSLDGGITWNTPDSANALQSKGGATFFWDGVSNTLYLAILRNSFGIQPLKLQNFDMDAEAYSAEYGNVAGQPNLTFEGTLGLYRSSDGTLFCFMTKNTGGLNTRAVLYTFAGGAWSAEIDYGNAPGTLSIWNRAIIDQPNNICHVFWQEGASFFYRQIHSDGTMEPITTFPAGWNLSPPRLQFGLCFSNGYINSAGDISIPAFSINAGLFSLNNIVGTPASSASPTFSQSPSIDTATGIGAGQDPGAAVAFTDGHIDYIAYFLGDNSGNFYNLVKLAQNTGSGWSAGLVYDALLDPNASPNPFNDQWLNTISGAAAPNGAIRYQFSTWVDYPGDANYSVLSTAAAATATVDCSITIDRANQTSPPAGGGGTGRKCRTIQCHSRLQNTCVGWGPLTVMQDRVGVRVVYQDTRGDVRTAMLPQGVEPFRYMAWLITKWEKAPVGYNNPGNLKARGGMLDKGGQIVAFANLAQGQAALMEVIHLSLEPDGEVM